MGSKPPVNTMQVLNAADVAAIKEIRQDDIIIALMGPSGSGKSYLVDLLASQPGKRAQSGLSPSRTTEVKPTRVKHPVYGNRIVLLDTPGFDGSTINALGPFQVLQKIRNWLAYHYDDHVRLTGLVYLQQITNPGEPYHHEALAKELCGDTIMSRVILVTTMWHEIEMEEGIRREQDLTRIWSTLTHSQSSVHRLGDGFTDTDKPDALRKSAWNFIVPLITKHDDRESVLLQEDFAALKTELCKAKEGKAVWDQLQENLMMRMEIQRKLSQALQQDRVQQEMLRKLDAELRDTMHRVTKWKGRRLTAMLKRAVSWPSKARRQHKRSKTKHFSPKEPDNRETDPQTPEDSSDRSNEQSCSRSWLTTDHVGTRTPSQSCDGRGEA